MCHTTLDIYRQSRLPDSKVERSEGDFHLARRAWMKHLSAGVVPQNEIIGIRAAEIPGTLVEEDQGQVKIAVVRQLYGGREGGGIDRPLTEVVAGRTLIRRGHPGKNTAAVVVTPKRLDRKIVASGPDAVNSHPVTFIASLSSIFIQVIPDIVIPGINPGVGQRLGPLMAGDFADAVEDAVTREIKTVVHRESPAPWHILPWGIRHVRQGDIRIEAAVEDIVIPGARMPGTGAPSFANK